MAFDPSIYNEPLDLLADFGLARPPKKRIIIRAIMATSGSELADGIGRNTQNADCYEVVAVGRDVDAEIQPGMHLQHASAAADRLEWGREDSEVWLLHEDDVLCFWEPLAYQERIHEMRAQRALEGEATFREKVRAWEGGA